MVNGNGHCSGAMIEMVSVQKFKGKYLVPGFFAALGLFLADFYCHGGYLISAVDLIKQFQYTIQHYAPHFQQLDIIGMPAVLFIQHGVISLFCNHIIQAGQLLLDIFYQ